MPDNLIELTGLAEWVSYVASTQEEAEAFALEANRWWAGTRQFPCPLDEFVPASAFIAEFTASQSVHGRWAVYVDCGWTLSTHASVREAVAAANELHDAHGVSRAEIGKIVFGTVYNPVPDPSARPLLFLELELAIYVGTPQGLVSCRITGTKGALVITERFVRPSKRQCRFALCAN